MLAPQFWALENRIGADHFKKDWRHPVPRSDATPGRSGRRLRLRRRCRRSALGGPWILPTLTEAQPLESGSGIINHRLASLVPSPWAAAPTSAPAGASSQPENPPRGRSPKTGRLAPPP